jgi:glutathione peroxidase
MHFRRLLALPALAVGLLCSSCRAADPIVLPPDVWGFTLTANDGKPYPLAQHRGKVLLVVNTASRCGFTKQYAGLQALHASHGERGLVLLGQPSNDFMGQEPGSDADIAMFCTTKFGVTFPLLAKASVSGSDQIPLFQYLTQAPPKPGKVSWNFNKFLIGRDGVLVDRFGSKTAPDDAAFLAAIEKALAMPEPAR